MNYPKYNLPSFTSGYRHKPSEFLLTLIQMQPQQEEFLTMGKMKDTQDQHFFKVWSPGQKKTQKTNNQKNPQIPNPYKTQIKKLQRKPSPDKETKKPSLRSFTSAIKWKVRCPVWELPLGQCLCSCPAPTGCHSKGFTASSGNSPTRILVAKG